LRPSQGIILGKEVVSKLATADSEEKIQQRLEVLPELEPIVGRNRERQAQIERWGGLDEYTATMQQISGLEHLQTRIEVSRTALADIDRQEIPIVWAVVALDLADNLRTEAFMKEAPDMQEAISLYKEILKILTPKGEPDQWGHAHHYLGDAYLQNTGGDLAEDIENAIKAYESALGVRRRAVELKLWATTVINLSEALRRRVRGDHAVNIDRAVDLLEQVVEALEGHDELQMIAMSRVNLGAALFDRVTGTEKDNFEGATEQLRIVIKIVDPIHYPEIWSMASYNLGSFYWKQAHVDMGNYTDFLEQAEHYFQHALELIETKIGARMRALLHMGLGLVLSDRIGIGEIAYDEAIDHYKAALAEMEGRGGDTQCGKGMCLFEYCPALYGSTD
jgi:tetratricopeptide (TPR) repeat protein